MDKVAISWAGGKDSSLACYKVMLAGYEVSYLLNFITQDARASMTHGLSSELLRAQARAIEIPIIQRRTTWAGYEKELKSAIKELKQEGVQAIVFGEIELQAHRNWIERVCKEEGVKPLLPLWGSKPEKIFDDLIQEKFEAIVVSTEDKVLGKRWLGRKVNKEFVKDLYHLKDEFGIHPCGENGEYHTFVIDGPIFKEQIDILNADKLLKEKQWFLKITKYRLRKKR